MSMPLEKLQQLSGLLKEYAAEQESLRLPNLAAQVRDVADCVEQDAEVIVRDAPPDDWEPDLNAETGRERHEREYREKYR